MDIIYIRDNTIVLGKRGEDSARKLIFANNVQATTATIVHRRATDANPYAVTCMLTSAGVEWVVKPIDVSVPGDGEAEVTYYSGAEILKSVTYKTVVIESVETGTTIVPQPVAQTVLTQITTAKNQATTAAASAATSAATVSVGVDALTAINTTYAENLQKDYIDVKTSAETVSGIYIKSETSGQSTDYKIAASSNAVCYVMPCEAGQVFRVRKPVSANVGGTDPNRFVIGFTAAYPAIGAVCVNAKRQNRHNEIFIQAGDGAKYMVAYVYYEIRNSAGAVLTDREAVLSSVRIWRETIGRRSNTDFFLYYSDAESYNTFRDAMNSAAKRIGMNDSYFYAASGLTRMSVTTPRDMAKLAIACASSVKVCDWLSTTDFTLNVHGVNPRTYEKTAKAVPNGALVSNGFPSLAAKGGSIACSVSPDRSDWGTAYNAERDTVFTRFLNTLQFFDVACRPCLLVVAITDNNGCAESQSYVDAVTGDRGFGLARSYIRPATVEVAEMLKYSMGERDTAPATPHADVIVREGGGYIALSLPAIPALYNNAYSVSQMINRADVVSAGADIITMPASISKLLTAYVAAEYAEHFHRRMMVRFNDVSDGSGAYYNEGDEIRMDDAARVCMMESSNTLAHMIGREVGLAILHAKNNPPEYDTEKDAKDGAGERVEE